MKTMKQNRIRKFAALFLAVVMILSVATPYLAVEEENTIYIRTAQELVELSKNCGYDEWSRGKRVVLCNDISLKNSDFETIPYFAGTFDGQGYTISDFELDEKIHPTGFISITETGAVVQNLTITGVVIPSGDNSNVGGIVGENGGSIQDCKFSGMVSGDENVGGIAGINTETGLITSCSVSGTIYGEFATGGIVGKNLGNILGCINLAFVNNTSKDASLSVDEIGTNLILDPNALNSSDVTKVVTDTGGIAGYSTGMIGDCTNNERIGYDRVGYNVGGIVGRNSGYVYNCNNYGEILGRKDVGGIVGQAEPYVLVDITSSQLAILEGQFLVLEEQMDTLSSDMKDMGDNVEKSWDKISIYLSEARKSLDALNKLFEEENDQLSDDLEVLEKTLEKVEKEVEKIETTLEALEKALDGLDATLDGIESTTSAEIKELRANIAELERLTEELQKQMEELDEVETREDLDEFLKDTYAMLDEVQDILETLGDMLNSLEEYLEYMDGALQEVSAYRAEIETYLREITGYLKNIKGYLDELDVQGKVDHIQEFHTAVTKHANALMDSLEKASDEMDALADNVEEDADQIEKDIEIIETQIHSMIDTIKNILDDTPDNDIISDVTVEDIASTTYGKIAGSVNYASVSGDINIGGIAGNMSLESELDPEDELSSDISWRERKEYELKTILFKCTNNGKITANKDAVGAICGQMDVGLISDCYGYGTITSENGDYVGGIAGIARTTITNCVANCRLSGNDYIGGILGSGYDFDEGKSSVSNCYSIVSVAKGQQYVGAIAGCNIGDFSNNYFVSSELQGINHVSYKGKAQPISYQELVGIEWVPVEIESFTLTFVVDDKVIKTQEFAYGDSFGAEVYPELPEKNGYDGKWDITELKNLCFDTIVTAVYTPYLTAIQSEEVRKNDRPVVLVEGEFASDDVVFLSHVGITDDIQNEFLMSGKLVEYWRLTFSDDDQVRHTVRFLPEKGYENAKLYMKVNGVWERVETETIGSYLAFETTDTVIDLAVVTSGMQILILLGILVGIVAFVALGIVLHKKFHVFSKLSKIIAKRWPVFIVLSAILGSVVTGMIIMMPKVQNGMEIASIIQDALNQENQSMKMELNVNAGEIQFELQTDMYNIKQKDMQFLVLEVSERPVYVCEGNIFFENGKGFKLGTNWNDDDSILKQVKDIYSSAEIERMEFGGDVVYSVTAQNEKAKRLINALMPSVGENLSSVKTVELHITTYNNEIQKIEIVGNANLKDSMDTNVMIEATLSDFETLDKEEYIIPRDILTAVDKSKSSELPEFGKDLYRLFVAWMEFNGKEEVKGTVSLDTSCGSINFKAELPWSSKGMHTTEIPNPEEIEELPEFIYTICLEGEFTCEKKANSYIYTMKLEEDTMKKLAGMISPEIVAETVNLSNGNIYVTVENDRVSSIEVDIKGTVTVLLVEIDAFVKALYTFE